MRSILVVDDHAVVREGVARILAGIPGGVAVDEAESGEGALEAARRNRYDLVILDISMPGRGGLETLKQLKIEQPALSVLILSVHPEAQYAERSLRSGASGYVTKDRTAQELTEAVRRILDGGTYVSPELATLLVRRLTGQIDRAPGPALSDREIQVLCMIARGLKTSRIAEQLHLSAKTVSNYRARLLAKLGLGSNAELARYALDEGLIS